MMWRGFVSKFYGTTFVFFSIIAVETFEKTKHLITLMYESYSTKAEGLSFGAFMLRVS